MAQVRAEADRVFKRGGGGFKVPSREAVDGMEFTLAALKESLRKYSVVPVVTRNLVQVRPAPGAPPLVGALPGHRTHSCQALATPMDPSGVLVLCATLAS
jgi:hypothetical protein